MTTTMLNVEGMSCNHCVMSVTKALKELTGVREVKVSLSDGKVTIEHEGANERIPEFKNAIEAQGYDVV